MINFIGIRKVGTTHVLVEWNKKKRMAEVTAIDPSKIYVTVPEMNRRAELYKKGYSLKEILKMESKDDTSN